MFTARVRESLWGYGFVAVPMAVFGLFFIYPFGYAIFISFYNWGILGKISYLGLDNYRNLWHDHLFWTWPPRRGTAIWNTLYYTAFVVPVVHTPMVEKL